MPPTNTSVQLQLRWFFIWTSVAVGFSLILYFKPTLFTDEQVKTITQFAFDDPESSFRAFRYGTYMSFILCGLVCAGQAFIGSNATLNTNAQRTVNWLLTSSGLFYGYAITSLSIALFKKDTHNFTQWLALASLSLLVVLQSLWVVSEMLNANSALQNPSLPPWKKKLRPYFGVLSLIVVCLGIYGFYYEWRSIIF